MVNASLDAGKEVNMNILVRQLGSDDYERLSAIMDQVQQLHVEWRPDVYKPNYPLISHEEFEELLKSGMWYVAEADGVVAGVLELMKRHVESPSHVTKDILFISTMAVDEKYRGHGIGHCFFDTIRQIREEQGFDAIELQVNARNRRAYEMYKKCGFTEKSINMELLQ